MLLTDRHSGGSDSGDTPRQHTQGRANCVQCAPRTSHQTAQGVQSVGTHCRYEPNRYEHPQMSRASQEEYYMCDCTQCRNLGNSVDICCQCCQCTALINSQERQAKQQKHYKVRSVSLRGENDETLEVCIANDENEGDHAEHTEIDDIALAHRAAGGCQSCPPPPPVTCSSCPPACNDPNCTACAQKCPHYNEWPSQSQHLPPNVVLNIEVK